VFHRLIGESGRKLSRSNRLEEFFFRLLNFFAIPLLSVIIYTFFLVFLSWLTDMPASYVEPITGWWRLLPFFLAVLINFIFVILFFSTLFFTEKAVGFLSEKISFIAKRQSVVKIVLTIILWVMLMIPWFLLFSYYWDFITLAAIGDTAFR